MSQPNRPPQRNNQQQRPRPQNPQQGQQAYPQNPNQPYQAQQGQQPYPPQQSGYPQQQGQQAPYGRPMPPPAPAPDYQQPLPPQQPSQPEKIYLEKRSNPVMMVLTVLAYPFVKLFQLIGNIFSIILQELVRSLVSFVLGITLLIVFVALIAGYGYALYLTNFDFGAALPEMFRLFGSLVGFGGYIYPYFF